MQVQSCGKDYHCVIKRGNTLNEATQSVHDLVSQFNLVCLFQNLIQVLDNGEGEGTQLHQWLSPLRLADRVDIILFDPPEDAAFIQLAWCLSRQWLVPCWSMTCRLLALHHLTGVVFVEQ